MSESDQVDLYTEFEQNSKFLRKWKNYNVPNDEIQAVLDFVFANYNQFVDQTLYYPHNLNSRYIIKIKSSVSEAYPKDLIWSPEECIAYRKNKVKD